MLGLFYIQLSKVLIPVVPPNKEKKSSTPNDSSVPTKGMMNIPVYYQWDYDDVPYGSGSIASCGCGPTSFAMIASYLKGRKITPEDAISWCGNDYYVWGSGTSWSYFQAAADHWGIGQLTETTSAEKVLVSLADLHPVISIQDTGLFTQGGHFIVLRGVDTDWNVHVNDPNDNDSKNYNNRAFDMDTEIDATSCNYWIFPSK